MKSKVKIFTALLIFMVGAGLYGNDDCYRVKLSDIKNPPDWPEMFYRAKVSSDPVLGKADIDEDMFIHLFGTYDPQKGEFDLASNKNKNLGSCEQCLVLFVDDEYQRVSDNNDTKAKIFFQVKGTITIDDFIPTGGGLFGKMSKGSIKGVKLKEFRIRNWDTGELKNVKDPECVIIEDTEWDTICTPDCSGKVCGDDGCGGSCGKCGNDLQCNAEGSECKPYDCKKVEITDIRHAGYEGSPEYWMSDTLSVGGSEADLFNMALFDAKDGQTYDLADETNDNHSYCAQCLLVYEDNKGGEEFNKIYYQQSGKLTVEEFQQDASGEINGKSKGYYKDVRLVEVQIQEGTYDSIVVQGGECLELKDGGWNTVNSDPVTVPDEDKDSDQPDEDLIEENPDSDHVDSGSDENNSVNDKNDNENPGSTDDDKSDSNNGQDNSGNGSDSSSGTGDEFDQTDTDTPEGEDEAACSILLI